MEILSESRSPVFSNSAIEDGVILAAMASMVEVTTSRFDPMAHGLDFQSSPISLPSSSALANDTFLLVAGVSVSAASMTGVEYTEGDVSIQEKSFSLVLLSNLLGSSCFFCMGVSMEEEMVADEAVVVVVVAEAVVIVEAELSVGADDVVVEDDVLVVEIDGAGVEEASGLEAAAIFISKSSCVTRFGFGVSEWCISAVTVIMFDGGGAGTEEVSGAWEEADTGARDEAGAREEVKARPGDRVGAEEDSVGPVVVAGALEEAGGGPVAVEAGAGAEEGRGCITRSIRSAELAGAIRLYPAMVTNDTASCRAAFESSSVGVGPRVSRKLLACLVSGVGESVSSLSSSDTSMSETILTFISRRFFMDLYNNFSLKLDKSCWSETILLSSCRNVCFRLLLMKWP